MEEKEKEIVDPRKVFSFSQESRVKTRESEKGNPRKCWVFTLMTFW